MNLQLGVYLIKIVHCTRISSSRHPVFPNRLQNHTLFDALLEPAILTPVPLRLRNFAASLRHACVHPSVLHSPLEEAFASARKSIKFS